MSDDQSVPPAGPPPPPDQAIADTRVVGPVYRGVRRLAVFLSGVPLLLGGCVLLALVIVVVLNQLDKLLKAMHPAQLPAYGVSSLSPLPGIGSTPRPENVRHVWSAWSTTADTPSHAEPTWVLHWYLGIDLLYIVVYSIVLAILLVRARGALLEVRSAREGGLTNDDRVYIRWIGFALLAVPLLALTDLLEDAAQWCLGSYSSFDWLRYPASGLTALKFFLAGAIVVVLFFVWLGVWLDRPNEERWRWLADLRLSRIPALLVAAFALLLLGPGPLSDQSLDVMRRLSDRWDLIAIPLALLLLFTAVLGASSRALLIKHQASGGDRVGPPAAHAKLIQGSVFAGGVVIAVVLYWLSTKTSNVPVGLCVPFGIAALVAGLSLLAFGADTQNPPEAPGSTFVSRLIVTLPLLVFGIAAIEAATGEIFYVGGSSPILLFAAVGLPCVVIAGAVSAVLRRIDRRTADPDDPRPNEWNHWHRTVRGREISIAVAVVLAVGTGVGLAFLVITWISPWDAAAWSDGAISVTLTALTFAALLGLGLSLIGERTRVPPVFSLLRLKRIPVVALLVLWFLVASRIDTVGTNQVRVLPPSTNPPRHTYTLKELFDKWAGETNPTVVDAATTGQRVRPLVFVTAEGGGIKAAYWTALVLDCLVEDSSICDRGSTHVAPNSIFAASAASGGSLGLVEYATSQDHPGDAAKLKPNWVNGSLGGDFLGPTFAQMLYVDVPNSFIRERSWSDRAAVLEQSWEKPWPTKGSDLQEGLYRRGQTFPVLLLNGTSVTEGCRFETSVLAAAVNDPLLDGHQPATSRDCRSPVPIEANPTNGSVNWTLAATKDIDEYVCPAQDVRLSTAALLSARFPIISPSGKIGCKDFGNGSSYVVDGGYYDNTGASTISELWTKLQTMVATTNHAAGNGTCIVPYLIEIDNHYGPPSPPTSARPYEVTVPTTTLNTVRDGHEADWLLGLANQFGKSRVAVIYPRSHPGAEAPLGWTLSRTTEKDLEDQLKNAQVEQELATARGFFTPGTQSCANAPGR